jgi:hypothetical protein
VADLVTRSLELPPDMGLGGVEIDVFPGEPECFTTAQPEHEN